jgi:hypothetical protein
MRNELVGNFMNTYIKSMKNGNSGKEKFYKIIMNFSTQNYSLRLCSRIRVKN